MNTTCLSEVWPAVAAVMVMACWWAALELLSGCYQRRDAVGRVFYAFALVGLSGLAWWGAWLLVPVVWAAMGLAVYCLSGRTLAASLLGLALPCWVVAAVALAMGHTLLPSIEHTDLHGFILSVRAASPMLFSYTDSTNFLLLGATEPTLHGFLFSTSFSLAVFGVVAAIALAGEVWFALSSRGSKVRVRELHRAWRMLFAAAVVFVMLLPLHAMPLAGMVAAVAWRSWKTK